MTAPKNRYRIPPCAPYDIPAMQGWLEDMAAKGLHLSKDGFFGFFTTFEVGPPKQERFRLEPTDRKNGLFSREYDPDDAQVQMLRQMGWTYRARRGQFYIFSTDDPDAPELNTDPQVQAMTMAALTKHLWKSLGYTLFLTIFYLLLYFGNALITLAIGLGTWRLGLLVGLLLWDLGRRIAQLVTLHRYRRQLQQGQPLPHRCDRREGLYLASQALRKVLWVAAILLILGRVLPWMAGENHVPLCEYTAPLPFPTLSDLYPDGEVHRMDGILENEIYSWSDPLAPENYDFTEYARVTLDGTATDYYLTVAYHRTRWEWTARMMAKEMVSQAAGGAAYQLGVRYFGRDSLFVTETVLPGADYCAWYHSGLPEPYLILQVDNVILRVRLADFSQGSEPAPEELAQLIISHILQ